MISSNRFTCLTGRREGIVENIVSNSVEMLFFVVLWLLGVTAACISSYTKPGKGYSAPKYFPKPKQ